MSDFEANLEPEDILWAADRMTQLDPIYREKHAQGIRCMLAGVIYVSRTEELVGSDLDGPEALALKGRALALSMLLQKQQFRVSLECGDIDAVMEWSVVHKDDINSVAYELLLEPPIENETTSPPPPTRYLMILAAW